MLTWARCELPDRAFPYLARSQQGTPCSRGGTQQHSRSPAAHLCTAQRCCLCPRTSLRRTGSAPGRLAGGKPRKMQLRAAGTAAGQTRTGASAPRCCATRRRGLHQLRRLEGERSELFLHLPSQTASSSGERLAAEPGRSLRSFPRIPCGRCQLCTADCRTRERDATTRRSA